MLREWLARLDSIVDPAHVAQAEARTRAALLFVRDLDSARALLSRR